MKKYIVCLFFLLFLPLQGCVNSTAVNKQASQMSHVGFSSERLARIKPVMQNMIDTGKLAGALTLVSRRGAIAHFEVVGKRDLITKTEMTKDTIFRIYSMTKPITSVAIMQLFEQGHFTLDTPLSTFIPAFKNVKVFKAMQGDEMVLEALKTPMTIRHLLNHTSGLSYGFTQHPVDLLYQKESALLSSRSLEEAVEKLATLPLITQPNNTFVYSVSNDVLGRVVEIVSGMSFEEYLQQNIFQPLKMFDTGFYIPPEKLNRLATMYHPADKGDSIEPLKQSPLQITKDRFFPSGGGGLVSTAYDYLRFASMLLNGGELDGTRILGRKTVALMTMNHLPNDGTVPWDKHVGYGLGFATVLHEAGEGLMSSKGTYSWSGAGGTTFWVDPKEQLIGLFMTQLWNGDTTFHQQLKVLTHAAIVD